MMSHSPKQPVSELYRQADLSMLALRVDTARELVVLSGSFTSQTQSERH